MTDEPERIVSSTRDAHASEDEVTALADHYRRQLETVAINASLALFIMDEDQHCTYMNPAAEELTGFSLSELRGKPLHDYIHHTRPDGSQYPLEECPIDQAFPKNMRERGEEVFVHRDGHFYPVSFMASPILDDGKPVGTIIEVRDITEERRAAAEREQLLEDSSRFASEQAFLGNASAVLASSLDHDVTLTTLTRLAVQELADWCAVDELMPDGSIRRIAVAHPDPDKVALAYALGEKYPPDPEASHGVSNVLRTGEAEMMEEIPEDLLRSAAQDEEHLRIIRELGLRSYIAVPLIARGQILGALSLVAAESGRTFGEREMKVARELARRAAVAIDNARLYRESEEARIRLEEQAVELEAQAEELQLQAQQLEESQAELEAANEDLVAQIARAEAARKQAETATAVLDAFFAAAPLGAAFLDPDLRYRRINDTLAAIDGVQPEDVIGKTLPEVVPDFAPIVEPLYRQVLSTGRPILNRELVGPRRTEDGPPGHYLVNYFPVRTGDDAVIGVGLVALDLTDLEQARKREQVFAQVLEESRNEIYLFDSETLCFQQVNRGARENLGYTMDELRKMTPLDIKPDFEAPEFLKLVEPLRTGKKELLQFETVHERRDGSRYPVDVRLQLSDADERPVFVALIVDASERKAAEQELVSAKDLAEQANQAKSQFLTVMSHELRTPLNAIIGYGDLLEAEVAGPLNEQQQQQLSRIKSGARSLLELINQILSLARIESGKEEVIRAPVDIREVAFEAQTLIEALAAQKGLHLAGGLSDAPMPIVTDAGKVRQILLNLLGNAVKFTDEGEIGITLVRRDAENIEIRVRDTGPGIAPDMHDRIFEPFVQVDFSQTRQHGGTGLGLAVSRELARLLGGNLSVESAPGEGSTFILSLPTG
jgi:PAS domain S-box-containing protein